jgi:hypothetical protein
MTKLPSARETRWNRMNSYWRTTLRCPNGTAIRRGVLEQQPVAQVTLLPNAPGELRKLLDEMDINELNPS